MVRDINYRRCLAKNTKAAANEWETNLALPTQQLARELIPTFSKWANALVEVFVGSTFLALSQLPLVAFESKQANGGKHDLEDGAWLFVHAGLLFAVAACPSGIVVVPVVISTRCSFWLQEPNDLRPKGDSALRSRHERNTNRGKEPGFVFLFGIVATKRHLAELAAKIFVVLVVELLVSSSVVGAENDGADTTVESKDRAQK